MKSAKKNHIMLFVIMLVYGLSIQAAYAYLDPGTGSYMLQILIAGSQTGALKAFVVDKTSGTASITAIPLAVFLIGCSTRVNFPTGVTYFQVISSLSTPICQSFLAFCCSPF